MHRLDRGRSPYLTSIGRLCCQGYSLVAAPHWRGFALTAGAVGYRVDSEGGQTHQKLFVEQKSKKGPPTAAAGDNTPACLRSALREERVAPLPWPAGALFMLPTRIRGRPRTCPRSRRCLSDRCWPPRRARHACHFDVRLCPRPGGGARLSGRMYGMHGRGGWRPTKHTHPGRHSAATRVPTDELEVLNMHGQEVRGRGGRGWVSALGVLEALGRLPRPTPAQRCLGPN